MVDTIEKNKQQQQQRNKELSYIYCPNLNKNQGFLFVYPGFLWSCEVVLLWLWPVKLCKYSQSLLFDAFTDDWCTLLIKSLFLAGHEDYIEKESHEKSRIAWVFWLFSL